VAQARTLLESLMIRRIKADVEASLLPKLEYVLKVRDPNPLERAR
jgi:SNF2 family DNA or RNA helicase